MISLFGLDPTTWKPHPLHGVQQAFAETNCYTDVLIELIAAAGHDPVAALGGTVGIDHEWDQWTFFKPNDEDLYLLYGMEIHEMQPYRTLPEQIAQRLEVGETLIPELDGYWLPDVAATSYHSEHVKTSVVAEAIDLDQQVLRYFHNTGYHELSGTDYRGVFRLDDHRDDVLPPYVDTVRFAGPSAPHPRRAARGLLLAHLARRPARNPFERFRARLAADLPHLLDSDLREYHSYAFANARMAGSGFGLLATHVRWLFGEEGEKSAAAFDQIVDSSKVLLFQLARRRPFDVAAAIEPMAQAWEDGNLELDRLAFT